MSTTAPTPPRSRWFKLVWAIPAVLIGLALIVLAANGIRGLPAVKDFMTTYPGHSELPSGAPVGFPAWLGWQHFLFPAVHHPHGLADPHREARRRVLDSQEHRRL
jgi:hypothetical protein